MLEIPHNRVTIPEGRVRDATDANWVDRYAPPGLRPFLRLSRADRPIGTWLLMLPCWWGIGLGALATGWHMGDLWLFAASALGAFLMRGAGCTWNDLVDRDIDAGVARTRSRPLPSGQVTIRNAVLWLGTQALLAFVILLSLNGAAVALGILSLVPVAVYPFAKRFTWWPQVFLGIAFNWGVLLLYAAHTGGIGIAPVLLYLTGIAWTLHYDTIYAHQDREDDALIGVKSTARRFGGDSAGWLTIFTAAVAVLGTAAILTGGGGILALIGLGGLVVQMAGQIRSLDIDDPELCLRMFRSTRHGGIVLAVGLFLDTLI